MPLWRAIPSSWICLTYLMAMRLCSVGTQASDLGICDELQDSSFIHSPACEAVTRCS